MLRGTAALLGKIGVLAFLEMLGIDQEEMGFQVIACRPFLDERRLLLQGRQLPGVHVGAMTHPDIEITGLRIGDGSAAAHNEDGMYIEIPFRPAPIDEAWGQILALLLVVRVITRFALKRPAPADAGHPALNLLAKVVHFLLYVGVFGMLLSGAGMSVQAGLNEVFAGNAVLPEDFFVYPPRSGHGLTFSILFILILIHFGAAMYHQFIRKDNLLSRMWFGKK